jgi:release factor glutamine methyltransferase
MRKWTAREFSLLCQSGMDPFDLANKVDEHVPVEYVIGCANFLDYTFFVNQYTLIPRVETEELVKIALDFIKKYNLKYVEFYDIGTGCGNIGISFALELRKSNIKFTGSLVDVSNDALEIAKKNCKKYSLDLRIINKDVRELNISSSANVILANLPYIPSGRISNLQASVCEYEPLLALDGGKNGLELIEVLIKKLEKLENLAFGILEVDDTHTSPINTQNISISPINDQNGKNRFWIIDKN